MVIVKCISTVLLSVIIIFQANAKEVDGEISVKKND